MQQENTSPLKNDGTEEHKGETISELAHRHLMDPNHTTTDEELLNAKVEFSDNIEEPQGSLFEVDNETVIPPLPGETGDTNDKEGTDTTAKPNPYDVLGS